ncbi:histidine kinase [Flavobacteriaceae bacterium S356]|uniref:Histidine kinase n=1 Tax=Asprobacillus argus TaxID=3076534 RepID=A0ABU3LDG8_9FLAO|nr:histidine kinase [Flavobacteriaceae bacterium S356]
MIPRVLNKYGAALYIILGFAFLILVSILGLYLPLFDDIQINVDQYSNFDLFKEGFYYIWELSLFILVSFLYWYFVKHKEEAQKALQFQNDKLKAELQVLKSQVSPHFLFNSLNNIYSLVIQKNDNAAIMIEKLSDILRYIIYECTKEKVSLQSEVTLLENYIQLQLLRKIRNEQAIQYHIQGNFSNKLIAPLLLINIVENCFKHSDINSSEDSFLSIDLILNSFTLTLKTKNTFTPNNKEQGIGLQNLRRQLEQIYPSDHILKIDSTQNIFMLELVLHLNE